jgi:hypothetical protein
MPDSATVVGPCLHFMLFMSLRVVMRLVSASGAPKVRINYLAAVPSTQDCQQPHHAWTLVVRDMNACC